MTLDSPQFTKINEQFSCLNCGTLVPVAQSTCRDHCPKCLFSLHVDNNPGDRAADCGGLLRPVGYHKHKKKGYLIEYNCDRCGAQKVNKFLEIDSIQTDDFDALLKLTPKAP